MNFEDYRHHTAIQIRFGDIDRLNHVNNACYLSYFETARVNYFRDIFKEQVNWSENGFVIARTEINYLKPLYLRDEIICFTKLVKIGNKSMAVKSAIARRIDSELTVCANGLIVLTAMDYTATTTIPVPQLWRDLISDFENELF